MGMGEGRKKHRDRVQTKYLYVPPGPPLFSPHSTHLYNCLDLSWQDESPGFKEISVVSIRHSTLRQLDLRGLAACSFITLVALLSRISSPAFFLFWTLHPSFAIRLV